MNRGSETAIMLFTLHSRTCSRCVIQRHCFRNFRHKKTEHGANNVLIILCLHSLHGRNNELCSVLLLLLVVIITTTRVEIILH